MKVIKFFWKAVLLPLLCMAAAGGVVFAEEPKEVQIVFTHDLHSHLEPFYLEEDGEEKMVGGAARFMGYLKEQRAQNKDLLYLDGGDFSMGTLYQTVYMTQAAELRMLGFLGADAV